MTARCREHGNVKPCPFDEPDEWWVRELLQGLERGDELPHLRGTCASCDEARRRVAPVVEQLPLGAT
jgi:hypothetical protein